jgi:hypothetical protein
MSALEVSLRFSGGSTMQAKVMESNSPPLKNGAKISGIFEQSAALRILCEDESQLSLTLGDRLFGYSPRCNWCSRILRIDKRRVPHPTSL